MRPGLLHSLATMQSLFENCMGKATRSGARTGRCRMLLAKEGKQWRATRHLHQRTGFIFSKAGDSERGAWHWKIPRIDAQEEV